MCKRCKDTVQHEYIFMQTEEKENVHLQLLHIKVHLYQYVKIFIPFINIKTNYS